MKDFITRFRPTKRSDFIGSQGVIDNLFRLLSDGHHTKQQSSPPHLLLCGKAGQGKTSLVALLKRHVTSLEWVDIDPTRPIAMLPVLQTSSSSLKAWLRPRNAQPQVTAPRCFILEDVDHIVDQSTTMNDLMKALVQSPMPVLCTCTLPRRVPSFIRQAFQTLTLDSLSSSQFRSLLQRYTTRLGIIIESASAEWELVRHFPDHNVTQLLQWIHQWARRAEFTYRPGLTTAVIRHLFSDAGGADTCDTSHTTDNIFLQYRRLVQSVRDDQYQNAIQLSGSDRFLAGMVEENYITCHETAFDSTGSDLERIAQAAEAISHTDVLQFRLENRMHDFGASHAISTLASIAPLRDCVSCPYSLQYPSRHGQEQRKTQRAALWSKLTHRPRFCETTHQLAWLQRMGYRTSVTTQDEPNNLCHPLPFLLQPMPGQLQPHINDLQLGVKMGSKVVVKSAASPIAVKTPRVKRARTRNTVPKTKRTKTRKAE